MQADAQKWDAKYQRRSDAAMDADELLVQWTHLMRGGRALDVACGLGQNAIYLAQRGYWVDAVDISFQALKQLRAYAQRRNLAVGCVAADLDYWPIPVMTYDLVAVFYFFAPQRMRELAAALRPGGLLFYATYNARHKSEKPEFNEAYLAPASGLSAFFSALEIVFDDPAAGDSGNISRLIARKP